MRDIRVIREELNALPFKNGKRELFVGRISELFENESSEAVADRLHQYEQELRTHALVLTRHDDDPDALFVVQGLRALTPDLTSMAEAMNWVSRITAVALEMILPGLVGTWLDSQLETRFLALLGLALGVPLGIWHLLVMTKSTPSAME